VIAARAAVSRKNPKTDFTGKPFYLARSETSPLQIP
jgi:hypothetical protein